MIILLQDEIKNIQDNIMNVILFQGYYKVSLI
jgi:hypothetical protein